MSKKIILFIVPIFILSIVLAFLSTSYKNNKIDTLANAKSNRTSNYYALKDLNQEELDNSGLLYKIKSSPDDVAKDADTRVRDFVDVLIESKDMKADKKDAYFDSHLKNYTTENIITNEEIKDMTLPKHYDVYINTSRGHYIQFMVKDADNNKPKKYFTIDYNNSTNKVEGIKEYDVRS
ncbi:hypothetical protein [Staphylococcus capitis]|uniref:hypothetical protein n=1 Tax=Staphylococcus capitis TaxID=29388 RepID=UPI000D1B2F9D|nr:hypothetical protein [Staphylococcus capitis]PTH39447.1 hypothetical protein BU619_08080 [Staphylococcus capitis]